MKREVTIAASLTALGLFMVGCQSATVGTTSEPAQVKITRTSVSSPASSDGGGRFADYGLEGRKLGAISAGETGCAPEDMTRVEVLEQESDEYVVWSFACGETRFVCGLVRERYEEYVRFGLSAVFAVAIVTSCKERMVVERSEALASVPRTTFPSSMFDFDSTPKPKPKTSPEAQRKTPGQTYPDSMFDFGDGARPSRKDPSPKAQRTKFPASMFDFDGDGATTQKPVEPKLQGALSVYDSSFNSCRGWAAAGRSSVSGEVRVTYTLRASGDTERISFTETTPAGVGACVRDVVDAVLVAPGDVGEGPRRVTTTVTFATGDGVSVQTTSAAK